MEYKMREDGTAGVPSSLFGFRRFRSCSPWFISGRENCREKPPPEITTVFSRNHPPPPRGASLFRSTGGTSSLPFDLLVRGISSRSWSAVPLQIATALQKRISTHKNSTYEKNRQLRNNFWEVTATSNYPATTFRAKATTLLQNEANARPKPFLWHKKIFML